MDSRDDEKVDAVPDTDATDATETTEDGSLMILYIALAIIILAIGIWIIVLMFSKEDSIRILEAMKAAQNQLTPVKDA